MSTALQKLPVKELKARMEKAAKNHAIMKQLLLIGRVQKEFANIKMKQHRKEEKDIEAELDRRSKIPLTHKPFAKLAELMSKGDKK
jgi:hypothetical protein